MESARNLCLGVGMSFLHLLVLGVIQGITEFFPISSSGHLILVPHFLGEADQGLLIDLGAHLGTLLAVIILFRHDVLRLIRGALDALRLRKTDNAKLLGLIFLGTIPGGILGLAIEDFQQTVLRHIEVIIFTSIFWGGALWWFDRVSRSDKSIDRDLTWKGVLLIGCAQALALVPGTSRSGITMTAARYLGFPRIEAARFSFLLSIPITAAAALLGFVELVRTPENHHNFDEFFIVAGISFVTALFAIVVLLKWLRHFDFTPFVLYRFALAAVLLIWFV